MQSPLNLSMAHRGFLRLAEDSDTADAASSPQHLGAVSRRLLQMTAMQGGCWETHVRSFRISSCSILPKPSLVMTCPLSRRALW